MVENIENKEDQSQGWNKNEQTLYRKLKLEVLAKLDIIDKNVEIHGLSAYDRKEQKELRE